MAEKKVATQSNYLIYDLETTGFNVGQHGICEVAFMVVDSVTLEELERYESIVAPYDSLQGYDEDGKGIFKPYEVTQGALDVNGLTVEKIAKGKPAKEVVEDIIEMCKRHFAGTKKPILCGHNVIKFDNPHLNNLFESHKKDLSKSVNDMYFIDTMVESWRAWPQLTGRGEHTLDAVCQRLGVEKFDAHSAMPDVIANTKAFIELQKRLRGTGTAVAEVKEVKERIREKFKF
jgi:DNA polymerase III epsilon subunit-like protein